MKLIATIGILLMPVLAFSASLRMSGDRVWLTAKGTPVPKVLELFERCGVEVLIDPALELDRIDGEWENTKIDRLVAQLASPHNYLIQWKLVKGPLGEFYQLSSIRIFSDGNEKVVKRLNTARVLDVVEGKDGITYVRGEIMVGFSNGSTMADLKALLAKLGGTVIEVINPPGIYRIKLKDGLSVEDALAIALEHEGVKGAEPNLAFPHNGSETVPLTGAREGANLHLHAGETAVAVFDSGLDPQYADLDFIRGTYNALDPSSPVDDPSGHGTLTSLIAAGAITPLGAEPAQTGTPVLSVQTFDENGMTSSDTIMRALDYAANSGVEIVSMSWGSEVDSGFVRAAMDHAAANGMTLYASAGNKPTGTRVFPAGNDSVIAVGGLNPDGTQWENSNFGDFVLIYEPALANFNGKSYAGTSISSPYAAFKDAQSE